MLIRATGFDRGWMVGGSGGRRRCFRPRRHRRRGWRPCTGTCAHSPGGTNSGRGAAMWEADHLGRVSIAKKREVDATNRSLAATAGAKREVTKVSRSAGIATSVARDAR